VKCLDYHLGLFEYYRIHHSSHVLGWNEMEFSSTYTIVYPNLCRLMRIRLDPNRYGPSLYFSVDTLGLKEYPYGDNSI
jgi:hypothetical protein